MQILCLFYDWPTIVLLVQALWVRGSWKPRRIRIPATLVWNSQNAFQIKLLPLANRHRRDSFEGPPYNWRLRKNSRQESEFA